MSLEYHHHHAFSQMYHIKVLVFLTTRYLTLPVPHLVNYCVLKEMIVNIGPGMDLSSELNPIHVFSSLLIRIKLRPRARLRAQRFAVKEDNKEILMEVMNVMKLTDHFESVLLSLNVSQTNFHHAISVQHWTVVAVGLIKTQRFKDPL